MTNGDRIRAMADAELLDVVFTEDFCTCCDKRGKNGGCKVMIKEGPWNRHCKIAGMKWLGSVNHDAAQD